MAEQKNPQAQENVSSQNINELIRVRREKLAALQEAGKDPFTITKYNQTHHTDEVKSLYNDHEAKLLAGRQQRDLTSSRLRMSSTRTTTRDEQSWTQTLSRYPSPDV